MSAAEKASKVLRGSIGATDRDVTIDRLHKAQDTAATLAEG